MTFTRRETLMLGLGAAALSALPFGARAAVDETDADAIIADFTGGAAIAESGVSLTAPEIAENGNTVPIAVDAPGASAIMVVAPGNPTPRVAIFNFGPLAASQSAATRIRLAGTQDLIVVAKMADGSFAKTTSTVKVTIGGCGG